MENMLLVLTWWLSFNSGQAILVLLDSGFTQTILAPTLYARVAPWYCTEPANRTVWSKSLEGGAQTPFSSIFKVRSPHSPRASEWPWSKSCGSPALPTPHNNPLLHNSANLFPLRLLPWLPPRLGVPSLLFLTILITFNLLGFCSSVTFGSTEVQAIKKSVFCHTFYLLS